jgi:hypothetical protein
MSASSARRRAKTVYRRELVEHRLGKFTEKADPAVVEASRRFHLRHWLAHAEQAIRREHREAFYGGLQPNLENLVSEHPGDTFPPELQRAIMDDLAFMEGHLEAFHEVMRLFQDARNRTLQE